MTRLSADAIGVKVDDGVEMRIKALDARDVLVGEFEGRDGAAAQEGELFDGGQQRDGHGLRKDSTRANRII